MIYPSVSVVVLNFEYHGFLRACLQSLFEQKRRPLEIIVMDDASPTNPRSVVEPFADLAPDLGIDLSLHVQERNLGTPGNMRSGLGLARGEYVMMLGADNKLDPWYVSRTARALDEHGRVGVVYTDAIVFGPLAEERSRGSSWRVNRRNDRHERVCADGSKGFIWEFFDFDNQADLRSVLAHRNFIHGSSLFRREVMDRHVDGLVPNIVDYGRRGATIRDLPRAEDWDFWKQVVIDLGWDAHHVRQPLLHYRQHSVNQRNVPKAANS